MFRKLHWEETHTAKEGSIMVRCPTLAQVQQEVARGTVKIQQSGPLTQYTYTKAVEMDYSLWNDVVRACRGLVWNEETGSWANCPMPKLPTINEELSSPIHKAWNKEDGSLILAFRANGEWIFTSKGSFEWEGIEVARKCFREELWPEIPEGVTLHFELVGYEPVVCTHHLAGGPKLIFLREQSWDFQEGNYQIRTDVDYLPDHIKKVKPMNLGFDEIRSMKDSDFEGVIALLEDGSWVKVKSEHYQRLHKTLANFGIKSDANIFEFWVTVGSEFLSNSNLPKYWVEELGSRFSQLQLKLDLNIQHKTRLREEIQSCGLSRKDLYTRFGKNINLLNASDDQIRQITLKEMAQEAGAKWNRVNK